MRVLGECYLTLGREVYSPLGRSEVIHPGPYFHQWPSSILAILGHIQSLFSVGLLPSATHGPHYLARNMTFVHDN